MRTVRYKANDEAPRYGWLHDNKIGDIDGDLFGAYQRMEAKTPLTDVKLLAPVRPSKIVCVGRNYVEHAKEHGEEVPKIPLLFFKPPSTSCSILAFPIAIMSTIYASFASFKTETVCGRT